MGHDPLTADLEQFLAERGRALLRVAILLTGTTGLYGVLATLPGVHFDAATDLAGRSGLGLYMVQDGYDKQEIVINPKSYTYMGYEDVAVKAQALTGTDGTRHVRKGQVLGWQALIASGVVARPGQTP